mgnify:CR=1 FL=1
MFLLQIEEPTESEVVPVDPSLLVRGRTRMDAVLSTNDDFVAAATDGTFALRMNLEAGTNIIEVVADVLTVIYAP